MRRWAGVRVGVLLILAAVAVGQPMVHPSGVVERVNITAVPQVDGQFVRYRNFAAYEWCAGTPVRAGRVLVEYSTGVHEVLLWRDGFWRTLSGAKKNVAPVRYAYVRAEEERWDSAQWVMPDGSNPQVRPNLRETVFLLMSHFPVPEIQDEMDRWEAIYRPGAPE